MNAILNKRRVVVTGLGMITPVGNDTQSAWQSILNGKSGVTKIDRFDCSDMSVQIYAGVKGFQPETVLSPKEARKLAGHVQYACAAAKQALDDAKLTISDALSPVAGVAIGAGIGGISIIENNYAQMVKSGPRRISPFFIPGSIINMAPGYVSIQHNLRGPNFSVVTACTTGLHNIGMAMRCIQYGDADVMVCGGTEMAITKLSIGGFASIKALSLRNDVPEKASRPWDKQRDGFVMGEGAGILVLESLEHVKKRGGKIYAELVGLGLSGDAYHITAMSPNGEGGRAAMENAVKDAGMQPEEVDYINAHGTSTPLADPIEVMAIKSAFGDHAHALAVSSTKSMTGHLLGATGAVEAAFCILAIRDQIAPPTINLDQPDQGCDLDFVPHKSRSMKINTALSNSFGFGGTNGSVLFKKYMD
jgi:3-oxoacyl-[acyl-carrier-protein] synthase II